MSQYSRFFVKSFAASKITAITLNESEAVLSVETLEGGLAEVKVRIQQFEEKKPRVGDYMVLPEGEAETYLKEWQLKNLGVEVSAEKQTEIESLRDA